MKIPENIENICLTDAYIDEDVLYAAGFEQNLLLRYDMKSRCLQRLGKFDGFVFPDSSYISAVFRYGESLFCFSKNSYEAAEFSLKSPNMRYYYPEDNEGGFGLIHSFCRVGDEIWLFQKTSASVVMVFSMEEKRYFKYEMKLVQNNKIDDPVVVRFENSIYIDKQIWRCIPGSSDLVTVHAETKNVCVIKTGLKIAFYTMSYENGAFYILSLDGRYIVEIHKDTLQPFVYETGYNGNMDRPFREVIKIRNNLFLLPRCQQDILLYKLQEGEISYEKCLKMPQGFKKIHDVENRSMFMGWKISNDALYLLPFAGNGMLCLELNSLEVTFYSIKLSKEDYLADWISSHCMVGEREIGIAEYLEVVRIGAKNRKAEVWLEESIGSAIWRKVCL